MKFDKNKNKVIIFILSIDSLGGFILSDVWKRFIDRLYVLECIMVFVRFLLCNNSFYLINGFFWMGFMNGLFR